MDVAYQALLSIGFPRREYWSGLPFPSPRNLLNPGIEFASPSVAGVFFTIEPPGKPSLTVHLYFVFIISFNKLVNINRCFLEFCKPFYKMVQSRERAMEKLTYSWLAELGVKTN